MIPEEKLEIIGKIPDTEYIVERVKRVIEDYKKSKSQLWEYRFSLLGIG